MRMRIGEVARRAGVSTRALRYYEAQGLLSSDRTYAGQRVYPDTAVERVRLIQRLLGAGLPSRTIVKLMPSIDAVRADPEVFALLASERERITARMAELGAARDALDHLVDIAKHPTPEHCPALRDPAWGPYVPAADAPDHAASAAA